MSSTKTKNKIKVENFYNKVKVDNTHFNPNPYMPRHPAFSVICGATGSMKTNTLLNILKNSGSYTKIYLHTKQPDEPLYSMIQQDLEGLETDDGSPVLEVSNTIEDLKPVDEFDPTEQNLIIIDDMISEGSKALKEQLADLFCRGRKKNISCIFITQDWYEIPKLLRGQIQYVFLKTLTSEADSNLIARSFGIKGKNLLQMIGKCQERDPENFFMIDKKTTDPKLRYRINFDTPIGDV